MATDGDRPGDYAAIAAAYAEAMVGTRPPAVALCSGAVLNAQGQTTEYDPSAWYVVSKAGISRVTWQEILDGD